MKRRDIGIILIMLTYLTMLGAVVYHQLNIGFKDAVDVAIYIGKNPYLFILNLILYFIGGYLLINDFRNNPDKLNNIIDMIFFVIPTINIVSALIYLAALAGGEGILIFSSGTYFILMYNTILYIIGISLQTKIRVKYRDIKIILGFIAIFVIYILFRLFIGVYPIIETIFLIIAIGYAYLTVKKKIFQ